ncbi:prolipoprotein diacylglyceryl transferase [Mycoplasma putrefaciens]|uniref:Prolipoprotein diacylglyceryl transferase n=1 Tax=Mycoplasma putrefaciens Mput9231 TaxID=1292033 RepID=M9WE24_9MOLU|nr:prolipoprotein diacylglyceryl transferase family protein [Mycoplasma putrefaciens]AGJ91031.1 Prolipoprotein diacylglyceryl transferase [Mycoplasma putrefaciens Mput9231]
MQNKLKLKIDKRSLLFIGLWSLLGLSLIIFLVLTTSLLRINWIGNNLFKDPSDPNNTSLTYHNVKSQYGSIRIYSLTMTLGMITAVGFSLYNFYKKGLSSNDLAISIIFIIPSSLLGASFFGKLEDDQVRSFWELFAFWEGGLAIHGGVFAGTFVGIIVFYFIGRRTKVSLLVYGDAIIPNILLGQVIGRWGNFFNHEVLGAPVVKIADKIDQINDANIDKLFGQYLQNHSRPLWLPDIILKNCLSVYNGESTIINGVELQKDNLVLLSPIFFYESVLLLVCWIVINFIIPNIGRLFNKPLDQDQAFKIDFKFSVAQFFVPWLKSTDQKISYKDAWKKALTNNTEDNAVEKYQIKKAEIDASSKHAIVKKWQTNELLLQLNNKNNYVLTRSGVAMFSYFMLWNVVRYVLELTRSNDNLFISNNKDLSLAIIGLSIVVGFIGIICSQYLFCRLFRKPGWLYEIEYFSVVKVK